MFYYDKEKGMTIECKKDCTYYLNNDCGFCVCDKDYYNCKNCQQYDKSMKYDYYIRYENFIMVK